MPVYPLSVSAAADLKALLGLMRILKRTGARVLHTHNRWEDALGCAAARLTKVRWVTTLHDRINTDQEGNRDLSRKASLYGAILRRADLVLANSRATAADAVAEAGLDAARVVPITNGQDLSRLEGVVADASLLPAAACRVGLFARVRGTALQKKGIPEYVEAAASALRGGAEASFFLVGGTDGAGEEAGRLAREAGIPPERWRSVGWVQDARPLMAASDVVVCPSRFEGLPRALLEAMGLGRAVAGTAVDGIAELVRDGVDGLLVPARDPEALGRAIARLAGDPALRSRLGEAAGRRVREDYGAGKMAREHEEAYGRLGE